MKLLKVLIIFICLSMTLKPAFADNTQAGCALDMDFNTKAYTTSVSNTDIESQKKAKDGDNIWFSVVAQNVTNLITYQVEVIFDPNCLAFVTGVESQNAAGIQNLLKSENAQTIGFMAMLKPDTLNTINITNTIAGKATETTAPDGSGVLALLKFNVLSCQTPTELILSEVHYVDINEQDIKISNLSNAEIIPFSTQIQKGDITNDGVVDLKDAITSLEILTGNATNHTIVMEAMLSDSLKLSDVLYILNSLCDI